MIVDQRFIAGYGGPPTVAFSPVGTAETWRQEIAVPTGLTTRIAAVRNPSTEVLGYLQLPLRGRRCGQGSALARWLRLKAAKTVTGRKTYKTLHGLARHAQETHPYPRLRRFKGTAHVTSHVSS